MSIFILIVVLAVVLSLAPSKAAGDNDKIIL
jgi:hypothetical protein